jgi:hypothetical protein
VCAISFIAKMSYSNSEKQFFLHRLKSLQCLCSTTNSQLPNALLFIPGPDGRHNRGSVSILKYLFQGAVGKEIYEGLVDDRLESLEEIILLVQETSVSVFWRFSVLTNLIL